MPLWGDGDSVVTRCGAPGVPFRAFGFGPFCPTVDSRHDRSVSATTAMTTRLLNGAPQIPMTLR
jgi:hypothetical protein